MSTVTRKAPVTPATKALDALGLPYRAHPYEHGPGAHDYGAQAARALGVAPERVLKTLVTEADDRLVVAVVPVASSLDLKALAAATGTKRAAMAAPQIAERRTGYAVDGISPLGQRTRLPVVLDTGACAFGTVFVSGGRRGFDIELSPGDLLTATGGTIASIAAPR